MRNNKLSNYCSLKLQWQCRGMAAATAAQKCGREELSNIQIRGGSQEELPYFKGKEQWLRFPGAAVKKDHTSKVREAQVRR